MSGGLVIIKEHFWHNAEVEERPSTGGRGSELDVAVAVRFV